MAVNITSVNSATMNVMILLMLLLPDFCKPILAIIKKLVERIVRCSAIYVDHRRSKTVQPDDVARSLQKNGIKIYGSPGNCFMP